MAYKSITLDGINILDIGKVIDVTIEYQEEICPPNKKLVILAIDKSGSMCGKPFDNLKNAIINLITQLHDTHNFILVAYAGYEMTYNEKENKMVRTGNKDIIHYDFSDKPLEKIVNTIENIKPEIGRAHV